MTARRREPPPIVDNNPPRPPRREPPPDYGTSGGVSLTDEVVERAVAEAERGYPIESLHPRGLAGPEDLMATVTGAESPDEAARVLSGLVGLRRRQVDPDNDYVADGTRLPRYVQAAIKHEAALRGRTAQEIVRDVLLGRRPLSGELLDAHHMDIYGYPREVK